jgi:hypothetical protein
LFVCRKGVAQNGYEYSRPLAQVVFVGKRACHSELAQEVLRNKEEAKALWNKNVDFTKVPVEQLYSIRSVYASLFDAKLMI